MKVDPPSSSPLLLLLLQNVTIDDQRGGGANLNYSSPILPPSPASQSSSFSPSSSALSFLPSSSPSSLPLSSPSSLPLPSSSSSSLPLPSPPSDLEDLLLWTVREPTTVALSVMYSLSFSLGIVGNAMSLRVLTGRRGNSRLSGASATHLLLVNLAVCDLAVVLVCMPVTLGNQIYAQWVYGSFLCRAVPFTQAVSVSASVLTLTLTSVNRYISVRSPLRARTLFTRRRILAMVGVVWAASWAMCSPLAVLARREEVALGSLVLVVCQEAWPGPRLKQGYNVLLFLTLYCLPVSFNLTIGFLTVRRLGGGGPGGPGGPFTELDPRSQALHCARLRARRRIARLVVALVLMFAVSWLPLYLADLWIDRERQRPPSWLLQSRPFAQWLGLTNSALNPLCYCFLGDLYRSAHLLRSRLALLCCGSAHRKEEEEEGRGDDAVAVDTVSVKSQDAADTVVTSHPIILGELEGRGVGEEGAGKEEYKMADGEGGSSDHSISHWLSQSVRESSLFASQSETPVTPPPLCVDRKGAGP